MFLELWVPAFAKAGELKAYEAVYDVYRNGKRIASARANLSRQGSGEYIYSYDSKGEKGKARFFRASSKERSTFLYDEGNLKPLEYASENRIAGISKSWQAVFDWDANQASVSVKKDKYHVPVPLGALDPVTATFALSLAAASDQQAIDLQILDEEVVEQHRYEKIQTQQLDSLLGCLDTVRIDRIRQNSKRYTRSWLASGYNHILVKLDHGKTGDSHMSLQIKSLKINGQDQTAGVSCTKEPLIES